MLASPPPTTAGIIIIIIITTNSNLFLFYIIQTKHLPNSSHSTFFLKFQVTGLELLFSNLNFSLSLLKLFVAFGFPSMPL